MQYLSRNKLEQIAKTRGIKDYKNISKENLLIALLKSEQSITELPWSKDNNSKIEEIKTFFNELRSRFSEEKLKKLEERFVLEKALARI